MFANQVEDFCEFSDMHNCNRELLKFGLGKLKDMPEDHLDTMDPYQRGAHTLIWDSMMEGHEMMDKVKQRRPSSATTNYRTTTAKPNSYEDDQFAWKTPANNDYTGAASAKIETVVYRLPPPKGFVITNGPSQYVSPKGGYVPQQTNNYQGQAVKVNQAQQFNYQQKQQFTTQDHEDDMAAGDGAPLTGPMVVKVHLDGTPVQEKASLPQDEDLKQYKMSKAKIPTFH